MSARPEVQAAVAESTSFADLLTRLHAANYTGPIVLHFCGGVPQQVELPQPPPRPLRVPLHPPRRRARTAPAPVPTPAGA